MKCSLMCVLWAGCHCMSGTSMVRIVCCLFVCEWVLCKFFCNDLPVCLCALWLGPFPLSGLYVSLWFAFPLQFIIKGDFDKCAGGFYKPHWPQRKSCPLTGAGHTFLYWLSCCQGYLTELWVSFITDELLKPCFSKVYNSRSLTCRLIWYSIEFIKKVSTKNPNACFA